MQTKVYLHSSKETMGDKADELGLTGEAASQFRYALSEVEFDIEVNPETGMTKIIAVDGRKLMPEEEVTTATHPEPFGDA